MKDIAFIEKKEFIRTLVSSIIMLSFFSGCGPQVPVYLAIPDDTAPYNATPHSAEILLQEFALENGVNDTIGELFIWGNSQPIRIDPRIFTTTLTAKVARQLQSQGLTVALTEGWDKTLDNLPPQPINPKGIITGTVKKAWLTSQKKAVHTNYSLYLEIDCFIGLPKSAKMYTRRVMVNQENIKMSQKSSTLESMFNDGLNEAAKQLLKEISPLLREY